jgi:hypothetical protein
MTLGAIALLVSICTPARVGPLCSCIDRPALTTERDMARAVSQFHVVLDGVVASTTPDSANHGLRATIAVRRHWNGAKTDTLVVKTSFDGGTCGVGFTVGTRYLIFASESASGGWYTSICTPTRSWDREADRLAGLLGPPGSVH